MLSKGELLLNLRIKVQSVHAAHRTSAYCINDMAFEYLRLVALPELEEGEEFSREFINVHSFILRHTVVPSAVMQVNGYPTRQKKIHALSYVVHA